MKLNFTPKSKYELKAQLIFELLVENFSQTFYVGGMVRDLILNKKFIDIDIATEATPGQVIKILSSNNLNYFDKGLRYGVVIVPFEKQEIEITTFRIDQYSSNRFPKVKFTRDVAKDSLRRDFTINSLYLQAESNLVLDFHNGLKDITDKLIRFIGDPELRVKEDPLRILRAIRLDQEIKFSLEKNTQLAIEANYGLLQNISSAKIKKELDKIGSTKSKQSIQKELQTNHKFID